MIYLPLYLIHALWANTSSLLSLNLLLPTKIVATNGTIFTIKSKPPSLPPLAQNTLFYEKERLEKIKNKELVAQESALKAARAAVATAERKAKDELQVKGVADRKAKRERRKFVKEQIVLQSRGLIPPIPPELLLPIRDRQKEQTAEEAKEIRIRNQALYDTLAQKEKAYEEIKDKGLKEFGRKISIDPAILAIEQSFRIQRNPLSQIFINSNDNEGDDDNIIPTSPLGRIAISGDGEKGVNGMDLCSSPPVSVVSDDSFENNQDYIRFS
ncbi:hypothetical protein EG329_003481 [Mollisiaceae sp. DMI_Dod_QoI]|nr:hypothetical protein EG329_003481 [Helotiales sp. DMI_Dod_QoI]